MSELTFPAEINNLAVWSTVSTQSNAVSTDFPSAAQVVVASSPFRVGPFSLTSLNGGMRKNKRNTVDKDLPPTFPLKLHGWCLRRISSFDRRGLCPEINSGMVIVHDTPPPQNNNEYVQGSRRPLLRGLRMRRDGKLVIGLRKSSLCGRYTGMTVGWTSRLWVFLTRVRISALLCNHVRRM